LLFLCGLAPTLGSAAACDRSCLGALVTQYVDALVAHDPGRLPLAGDVRFTEDSRDLKLGEGLWKSVTAKDGFRQDYLDVNRQIAASHVALKEGSIPVLYSVLLHVEGGKIAGIETLVQRIQPDSRFQPAELGKPLVGMNDRVPAGKRQSREAMIRTALTYTEGLRIGSFEKAPTPFAKDAYRIENGMFMAGTGCPRADCPAILTQKIMLHPDVTASVAAVDEDNGVVVLWMNFGDTNSYGPGNALVTFEAFKVWDDQIHVVQAFFRTMPVATQRNWTSADAVPVLHAAAPSTAEARIQMIEDRTAIERVLLEYGRSLDNRDFATYSRLFAKDGEWIGALGAFHGPAAIQAAMEKIFANAKEIPKGSNFHVMSNFIIDIEGDRATARSHFVFYKMEGNKPQAEVAGRYEDVLIRENGAWKFLTRTALPPG
jgi:ketosteroid isomerase-like protein